MVKNNKTSNNKGTKNNKLGKTSNNVNLSPHFHDPSATFKPHKGKANSQHSKEHFIPQVLFLGRSQVTFHFAFLRIGKFQKQIICLEK